MPGKSQQQLLKQREKNRQRRMKKSQNKMNSMYAAPGPNGNLATSFYGGGAQRMVDIARKGRKLTMAGAAFLKCAFAPVDFAESDVSGVPTGDNFNIILSKFRLIQSITVAANTKSIFVLAPIPGYGYWKLEGLALTAGLSQTDFLVGVPYTTARALYTGSSTSTSVQATQVSKFRMVSNHFELVSTTQLMNAAGSISVFKTPIDLGSKALTGAGAIAYSVNGLDAVNSNDYRGFDGASLAGVYTAAYSDGRFEWSGIMEESPRIPLAVASTDFSGFDASGSFGIPGFDSSMQSTVIIVSNSSQVAQSFRLKTFQCVENRSVTGSVTFPYSHISPAEDLLALELYREVILNLPVAVIYADNESFWQRVLNIIKRISGSLAIMPGQYGMIAAGVNAVANGVEALTM